MVAKVLSAGAGLVAGALAGIAVYAAHQLSGPTRSGSRQTAYGFTPFETAVDFEPVSFTAADGVQLNGWWLARPQSQRVIIGCHGHRGGKQDLLGIGSGLWRAGMNVLLFDFRGRGASADSVCSLAYHEVADLRGAVRYAQERHAQAQIGVIGFSMGAAVTLLAAAEEPAIQALVLDSPFAVMRDVVDHAIGRRRLPVRPVVQLADHVTRRRYGYRFDQVRPIDVIARIAPRPLLLIHDAEDPIIPVDHARRLFAAAAEPKELWITPAVGHCGSYFLDRAGYVQRTADFFQATLPESSASRSPGDHSAE